MVARAAPGVSPRMSGTSRVSALSPTLNSTVEPYSMEVPPTGSCSTTLPSFSSPKSRATGSPKTTTKPSSSRVARASSGVSPTTLGTVVGTAPSEITSVTSPSRGRLEPAGGSTSMTNPSRTSAEGSCSIRTWAAVKPASVSLVRASLSRRPTTSGTISASLPAETTRSTTVLGSTSCPAGGSWEMTLPSSTTWETS